MSYRILQRGPGVSSQTIIWWTYSKWSKWLYNLIHRPYCTLSCDIDMNFAVTWRFFPICTFEKDRSWLKYTSYLMVMVKVMSRRNTCFSCGPYIANATLSNICCNCKRAVRIYPCFGIYVIKRNVFHDNCIMFMIFLRGNSGRMA